MNDAGDANGSVGQRRARWIRLLATAIAIAVSFVAGLRVGAARQEKRLLGEFLINASRLGIIDYGRLRELAEEPGANTGYETLSARGAGGEP